MGDRPETNFTTAALRNRTYIVDALREVFENHGVSQSSKVLEVACGNGAHVDALSETFREITWYPTDLDTSLFAPQVQCRDNVAKAQILDASAPVEQWPDSITQHRGEFKALLCINMIHISPWDATLGLMRGASDMLATDGVLCLYGPFFEEDVPTAPSNIAFDEHLKGRNVDFGIRRLTDVAAVAKSCGLVLVLRKALPANNLFVAFRK